MPTLDRGVPVDALNWTQVGSILPKFEYKEHYNPDYYHPGWKAQDKANYPKFSDGKNFSNNYYNYNLNSYKNRTISDSYEPGSTLKIIPLISSMKYNYDIENKKYFCENGS